MLLAPTTVLARQHAMLMTQRFAPFGVRVGFLTRFTSSVERDSISEGIEDGSLLLVIGTHALLAEAPRFRNLGLLVIDEEQRFGVREGRVASLSFLPPPLCCFSSLCGHVTWPLAKPALLRVVCPRIRRADLSSPSKPPPSNEFFTR